MFLFFFFLCLLSSLNLGQPQWKYVESKISKQWVAKTNFQKTQQLPFRMKLVDRVLIKAIQVPLEDTKKPKRKTLPKPNVAKTPMPDKLELQAKSSERFKHHSRGPDQDLLD